MVDSLPSKQKVRVRVPLPAYVIKYIPLSKLLAYKHGNCTSKYKLLVRRKENSCNGRIVASKAKG